jgi:Resolvase, N terminal domain
MKPARKRQICSQAGSGREELKGCASGDVLVVWKLDRLARSLHDLVVIAEDLKGRGVGLKILTGEGAAVDTTHPQGRMVFGILAVMAEFERELMRERTVAGIEAARKRGVRAKPLSRDSAFLFGIGCGHATLPRGEQRGCKRKCGGSKKRSAVAPCKGAVDPLHWSAPGAAP